MRLTGLDFLFWAAGFALNVTLLVILWYRRRAKSFPFFTALITLMVVKTILLYFVLHYGSRVNYFHTYWSLSIIDTTLQLCVVYEVASLVFRPLAVWAPDLRNSFGWLIGLSLIVALCITWLASPPARTWMQSFATKGNLFAAALLSELFVAMMGVSVSAGHCPGHGRIFSDRCVDRDRPRLFRRGTRDACVCCFVTSPHGRLPGLCGVLDIYSELR